MYRPLFVLVHFILCMGDTEKLQHRKLTKDWGREIKLESNAFSIYRFNKGAQIIRRHPGFIEYARSTTKFCTKSSYEGNYNSLGFAGFGEYVYPHGVRYEGDFKDGMFHGRGTLIYPVGQKIEGIWKKGKLMSYVFRFSDGLEYSSPWKYCQQPDRRFQSEKLCSLRPAGEEFLTDKQPSKPLNDGCFDTADGFFNPKTKCVYKDEHIYVKDKTKTYYCRQPPDIIRVCTEKEENLITANYRKAGDDAIGYCPSLYEQWTTGRKTESNQIKKILKKTPSLPTNTARISVSTLSLSKSSSSES